METEKIHLELFAGQGGTAHGYHLGTGLTVWSVDNDSRHHNRNPYAWHHGDWRDGLNRALDTGRIASIGASPPCTKNTAGTRAIDRSRYDNDPDLEHVRDVLIATGLPYIIENVDSEVTRRKMLNPITLCGLTFNLTTTDDDGTKLYLKRHRLFESNLPIHAGTHKCPGHPRDGKQYAGAYGGARRDKDEARYVRGGGYVPPNLNVLRSLLRAPEWMDERGIFLSVPPAYTMYLSQFMPYPTSSMTDLPPHSFPIHHPSS